MADDKSWNLTRSLLDVVTTLSTVPVPAPTDEKLLARIRLNMLIAAQVFAESPDAIIVVNGGANITMVNRAAETLFGYFETELLDQPIEILLPPERATIHREHVKIFVAHPRKRPMGLNLNIRGQTRAGAVIELEIKLDPFTSDAELFVIAIIRRSNRADAPISGRGR